MSHKRALIIFAHACEYYLDYIFKCRIDFACKYLLDYIFACRIDYACEYHLDYACEYHLTVIELRIKQKAQHYGWAFEYS